MTHQMTIPRREFLRLTASAAAIAGTSGVAVADTYPSRPIRLIVGFTAGAASDVIARIFARAAGPLVGQQIIVENRPGAGSSIAAHYVARGPKDGYTLFLPPLSTLTNEIINPSSPPLDMSKDFAPVAQLAEGPFFLTVNPALGVHSVAELVALAKAKPGELTYRFGRRRQPAASLRRAVRAEGRDQARARAVSGQSGVGHRSDRRPYHDVVRSRLVDHRADQGGPIGRLAATGARRVEPACPTCRP